jgi:16S rRNA (uracil1498-N3)-methyltransferase
LPGHLAKRAFRVGVAEGCGAWGDHLSAHAYPPYVRLAPGDTKWQCWQRIIQEAAEQSGRGRLSLLEDTIPFDEAIASAQGFALLPTVGANEPARHVLAESSWPVTLFLGPEGGFNDQEVELAQASGVRSVSLGPLILRTETATIALITMTMSALGELDGPGPLAT